MSVNASSATVAQFPPVRGGRYPIALGLALGGLASLGLWAGVFLGVRALIS